ncbi:MAG: ATP-binding protein [Eubacterium sp.]|nr:ATP-binding protein [Eubacterium sp.]
MEKEKINDLLFIAEQVINQSQYNNLSELKIIPLDDNSQCIHAEDVLCLFKISEIVYNESEASTDKFSIVFNALHSCGASCIMILECIEGRTELYLGAINKQKYENIYYLNVIRDILKTSIYGNLPGTEIKEVVSRKDIKKILQNTLDNGFDSQCITAVSCVANLQQADYTSSHGIEVLLSAVREINFSIIVMADPVSNEQIEIIKEGYEDLGTNLSALESMSLTIQTGSNYTTSENTSTSFNDSLTRGINLTQSHTLSGSYRREKNEQEKRAEAGKSIVKLAAGGIALAGSEGNMGAAYFAMNAAEQLLKGKSKDEQPANREIALRTRPNEVELIEQQTQERYGVVPDNLIDAKGIQQGLNINEQHGKTEQVGTGSSLTKVESTSIQKNTKDLHITALNDRLMNYLKWLSKSKNYGMFNCCTYIISGSASTNLFVAGQYQALIQSYGDSEQPVAINTWTKENNVEKIRNSLLHLVHPTFKYEKSDNTFSTAMLLSSNELSMQMAFPRKSILGVSVSKHASFGIEVVRKSSLLNGSLIRIGEVQHMGKSIGQPVLLDLQSLASHTFVSGTNGSGKSNTVFKILEELLRLKVPFLVIEPAKGEYKNIFGNDKDVAVYGTNPKKTKLLSFNPFWFNEDVTVHEHIDKLIDIFNASWSMSAAMPSVLKSSIENTYKAFGWNLKTSECLGKKKFPTVKDVLGEFNKKMKSTAFSEEVKGNYVGALSTRMESLCNGIYEDIFLGEDLGDEALFNNNVIIDLSRVGSTETKSIIMGFLLIRLQEYRMKNEALNLPLQHITILEEAHHLLRRTSAVQTSEGTNMLGKSVEMISNMIAEMRSYGEGFMIVDQSPGLLDISVMRNTNTKIIMRLFENSDRDLVGDTIDLSTEQKAELSKLKTGVAAIYQKEWLEPVLCLVDKAAHKECIYLYKPPVSQLESTIDVEKARGIAFEILMPLRKNDSHGNYDVHSTVKTLQKFTDTDKQLAELLIEYIKTNMVREKGIIEPYASIIWDLLDGYNIWEYLFGLILDRKLEMFDSLLREQINKFIQCNVETQTSIISLFLQKKGANPEVRDFYYKWAWKFMLNRQNEV